MPIRAATLIPTGASAGQYPSLTVGPNQSITIGRRPAGALHQHVNSKKISKVHCSVCVGDDDGVRVTDSSTNGTYINGVRVGTNKSVVLRQDDVLTFSVTASAEMPCYRVSLTGDDEQGAAGSAPAAPEAEVPSLMRLDRTSADDSKANESVSVPCRW